MDGTGMAPMFQPVGGMDQFPKGLARKLGDKITHGVEVVSIKQNPDGVKVAYKNLKTGAMTEASADYCMSCLPLTILTRLEVNLSPETLAAAKATPYSPSAKIGLQMKRRFWRRTTRSSAAICTRTCPSATSRILVGLLGSKGVMLGFYGNGQMSGLVNMPVKERIEHVLTTSARCIRRFVPSTRRPTAPSGRRRRTASERSQAAVAAATTNDWPRSVNRTAGSFSDARRSAATAAGRKAPSPPPGSR